MVRGENPRQGLGAFPHETPARGLTPDLMDAAIGGLFEQMYRMPPNVTRSQFRRGMRRIRIIQFVGGVFTVGFVWFSELMQNLS
jgi:hypothetical protein